MFNKRWKKVLAWSLSVVIVLAIGGLFAANYAINKLMTSMAEGIELESNNASVSETVLQAIPTITTVPTDSAVSDVSTNQSTNSNVDAPVENVVPQTTPQTAKESKQPADVNQSLKNDEQTSKITPKPTNNPITKDNKDLEGYSAQVSTDKAKHIQENVTVKEKADVASIVMGQLSMSDIKRLQELASGGLTIEEKREARSIILDKVSEEQYNELSQIAKKYGVSEGKTQGQVLAEEEQLKLQAERSE